MTTHPFPTGTTSTACRERRRVHPATRRRLHLVDLDNLIGGPGFRDRVVPTLGAFRGVAELADGDHLVIAAERTLAAEVAFDLPDSARLIVATGPDGADRRLVEDYPAAFVADRYDALVIGSGDGRFAALAAEVGRLGIPVIVVGCPRWTAKRLRMAAAQYRPLAPVLRAVA